MITQRLNKRISLIVIILAVMLTGCGGPNIENELSAKLLKTEKTLPEDMFGSLNLETATSEERMNDLWKRFGLGGRPPSVNFEVDEVYFVGILESGSCPIKFEGLGRSESLVEVTVHLSNPRQACPDDGTPRAYVLSIDKEESHNLQRLNAQVWYKSQAGYKLESVPIERN